MMNDDLELELQREVGPFHVCKTIAELLVLVNAMMGIEAVDRLLTETCYWRESLVEAADEVERVGLTDLALLIRRHARKAKPSKPARSQTDSAKVWLAKRKRSRRHSRDTGGL
jgi:hypothetical protein